MDSIPVKRANLQEPSNNKTEKWSRWFVLSAGVILLVTGSAKVVSVFGQARILGLADPVFRISFRHLMLSVGVFELFASGICLFSIRRNLSVGLVAWLATNFLGYRLGLVWVGSHKPCGCMGNLTDILHISPQMADSIMSIILAYLLIGSYGTLFWLWKQKHKLLMSTPSPLTPMA
jgi:hypothetical protein